MIKLNKISIKYDRELITDVDFHIKKSQYTVIKGDSGIGKTSLIKTFGNLDKPFSGKILVNGRQVDKSTILREDMSYCFQESVVYPSMTFYENILIGAKCKNIKPKYSKSEIEELCNYLGILFDFEKKNLNLSGGEKQKLNFLRSYIINPSILILDEPMSAMDPESKNKVKNLLSKLKKNTTIIHISHDNNEYSGLADCIVEIKDKKLVS